MSTALAPVPEQQARAAVRQAVGPFLKTLQNVLPATVTPERVMALAYVAAIKTPKLLECVPESIGMSIVRIAQWGLDIGTTAHLVPFYDKNVKGYVCTPIPDWKGVVQMCMNSRHVRDMFARAVYEKDHFRVRYGTENGLEHEPTFGDRGELIAVYAVAILAGHRSTFEVMTAAEVEKIRARAASGNSPAWRETFEEMAKKTVVKRLAKRLPQASQDKALADALGADGDQVSERRAQLQRVEAEHRRALPPGGHPLLDSEEPYGAPREVAWTDAPRSQPAAVVHPAPVTDAQRQRAEDAAAEPDPYDGDDAQGTLVEEPAPVHTAQRVDMPPPGRVQDALFPNEEPPRRRRSAQSEGH